MTFPSNNISKEIVPSEPLKEAGDTLDMSRFEVAIAVNVDPPYRHSQDYLWLEVVAMDKASANKVALDWLLKAPKHFEATGMVRSARFHDKTVGGEHGEQPLPVIWNTPIPESWPPYVVVRNPVNGLRIGFVAHNISERMWLPPEFDGIYRLISRDPSSTSVPVAVAPLVTLLDKNHPLNRLRPQDEPGQ